MHHAVVDREDLAQPNLAEVWHVCENEKYDEKRKISQFCGTLNPGLCLSLINKFVRVSQSPGAGCCPNFEQDVKMSKCLHLMIFLSLLFCKQKAFVPEPGLEKMFAPESWLQKNVCT